MPRESGRAVTPGKAIWDPESLPGALEGVEGYSVQAADGTLGRVTAASREPGRSYLIVATEGSWNHGRTVMLPPGVLARIDRDAKVIHISCLRTQIVDAPPFENDRYQDAAYRSEVGGYYASLHAASAPPATPGSVAPLGRGGGLVSGPRAEAHVPPHGRFALPEQSFERARAG